MGNRFMTSLVVLWNLNNTKMLNTKCECTLRSTPSFVQDFQNQKGRADGSGEKLLQKA